jgi:hypothetical protein
MWEIDIEADSAEEAAKEARRIQLDPKSWATLFSVCDSNAMTRTPKEHDVFDAMLVPPPGVEAGEVFMRLPEHQVLAFPSYEVEGDGCSYLRILDERGVELVIWDSAEWAEDPIGVMGAIMGAIYGGALPRPKKEKKKNGK